MSLMIRLKPLTERSWSRLRHSERQLTGAVAYWQSRPSSDVQGGQLFGISTGGGRAYGVAPVRFERRRPEQTTIQLSKMQERSEDGFGLGILSNPTRSSACSEGALQLNMTSTTHIKAGGP